MGCSPPWLLWCSGPRWQTLGKQSYRRSSQPSLRPPCLWTSLAAQLVKNLPDVQKTQAQPLGQEDPRRKDRLLTSVFLGFPGGSDGKESACNVGDLHSTPGSGRSPGEGNDYPLQYSRLENSMDRGIWQATVHGVAKSQTRLRDFQFGLIGSFCRCWSLNSRQRVLGYTTMGRQG